MIYGELDRYPLFIEGVVVAVFGWELDLQLPMQSVPTTTDVVSYDITEILLKVALNKYQTNKLSKLYLLILKPVLVHYIGQKLLLIVNNCLYYALSNTQEVDFL